MSNTEQALSAVAGGVIGFVGSGFNPVGAFYGFQVGLLAGSPLLPALELEYFTRTTVRPIGDPRPRPAGAAPSLAHARGVDWLLLRPDYSIVPGRPLVRIQLLGDCLAELTGCSHAYADRALPCRGGDFVVCRDRRSGAGFVKRLHVDEDGPWLEMTRSGVSVAAETHDILWPVVLADLRPLDEIAAEMPLETLDGARAAFARQHARAWEIVLADVPAGQPCEVDVGGMVHHALKRREYDVPPIDELIEHSVLPDDPALRKAFDGRRVTLEALHAFKREQRAVS